MGMRDDNSRYLVYLAHRQALISYATPILGSRDDAEDVVQEAFIKFVPQNAISTDAVKSYLFRIVRNLAIDLRRRRQLEMRQNPVDLPHWTAPQAESTPEQQTLFCEDLRRVTTFLSSLPPEHRIAIEMHRFGGYTMEEIADHLGVSIATVHRMLRKTLAALSEEVGQKN